MGLGNNGSLFSSTQLKLGNNGSIVDQNGYVRPLISRPIRNISTIGDSVVELSKMFGVSFGQPINIQKGNVTSVPRGSLTCPDGNGTLSLIYQDSRPYLQWTAPGDTPGPLVFVKDGIFVLPSGNPAWSLTMPVTSKWLPTINQTDILASSPANRYWRRPTGGFPYVADALTYGRFNWLTPLGIGSNTSVDVGNRYQQAIDQKPDLIIDRTGGNDVISGNMTIADSVAARLANWKLALSAGIPVIVMLMSARSSAALVTAATGSNPAVTAAQKGSILVAANAAYIKAANGLTGIYFVDCYTPSVDSATGFAKNNYTTDGVHWNSGLAYEAGVKIANILNILQPDDRTFRNIGAGSLFDATYNPGGNLLPTNQGAFSGTGGTAGTGATVGTGIAAGINVSTANCAVTCNKVASVDGGPDWQEYVISGSTVDGAFVKTFFGTGTLPNAGDLVSMSVEYEISGVGCYGIYADCPLTSTGLPVIWDAHQLDSIPQGMRNGGGVLAFEPIVWPANVTYFTVRVFIQCKNGAAFTARLRNADLRKVV